MSLKLTTPAFSSGGPIPAKYSKDGGNISPALSWSGVPNNTNSLVLIVDDPDAPGGLFVHWLLYGIPANISNLKEHLPAVKTLPDGSMQGVNGFGEIGYGGPQPPSGTHRYFFHLYALDKRLDLSPGSKREELDRAMREHIIGTTEIFGTYQHQKTGSHGA